MAPVSNLSPAAQAVLDVYRSSHLSINNLAAALRAAADQVVPVEPEPPELPFADVNDPWPSWNANQETRKKLLAIANELKTS